MKTDSELQQAITQSLSERPDVVHGELKVQVSNGIVTLTGRTRNELEKWQIEDAILGLPGVERLVNQTMIVSDSSSDPNSDIARSWTPSS